MLANRSILALAVGLILALAVAYAFTLWRYRRRWAGQEPTDGPDRRYYRDVTALALLLALVAGFFWRPLFNRDVTMPNGGGDLASFFYPIHVFASERLQAGELPLWNPHLFSGMPFAADIQSGLFYPLNWIFWLLGRPITYEKVEMLALVHYWLAACFTYAFVRSLGLGRWPGVLAGTLYAFSGFAVSHLGHLPMLASATWLPLILLSVNQAARPTALSTAKALALVENAPSRTEALPQADDLIQTQTPFPKKSRAIQKKADPSWGWAVAVGLLLAISLLAGHFQLFLYNFYAAAVFWLAIAWRGKDIRNQILDIRNQKSEITASQPDPALSPQSSVLIPHPSSLTPPRFWLGQALRGGLALGVLGGATLVQVWPFYELGQLSVRSAISYETSTQFGVWPTGLADLFLPNLFSPNPKAYFGYWSNTDVLGYIGLFTFALVGLGLLLPPVSQSKFYPVFFVSLGVAGLIFSLAGYTIFQGWFYQFVPALNLTRGAGRFLVWFDFGFAVAAAFGLQAWLNYRARPPEPEADRTLRWGWRTLALAGIGVLLVPLPLLYSQLLATPGTINDLLVRGIDGLVLAVIILGLGAVLLRLYYRRALGPDMAAFLALALLVFDLFSARANFNPTPGDVVNGFYQDGTATFLRSQDPTGQYRLDASVGSVTQAWQANTAQLYRLYDVRGLFNPLQLASYENFWNGVTAAQKDFRAVPAYNLLGARYVIARSKEDPTGPQFKAVYRDDRPGLKLVVWENSQALPRAILLHRTALKSLAETLPALLSPDFKPTELAYLEGGRTLEGASGPQLGEEIRLTSQSANRLSFEANAVSEGYVVINQPYYPGWQARLDGAEIPLEKADYTFQAVYLPPGKHNLTLEFAPTSFTLGLIVSLITWLAASGFLAWNFTRRRSYGTKQSK